MKQTFLTLVYLFIGILIINICLYLTSNQVLIGGMYNVSSPTGVFDREVSPLIEKASQLATEIDVAITKYKTNLSNLSVTPLPEKEKLYQIYSILLNNGAIGIRPHEIYRYSSLYLKRKLTAEEKESLSYYLLVIIENLVNLLQQLKPGIDLSIYEKVDPDRHELKLRQSETDNQTNIQTQTNDDKYVPNNLESSTNDELPNYQFTTESSIDTIKDIAKYWSVKGATVENFAPVFFTNEAFVPINERGRLEMEIKQGDIVGGFNSGVTFFTEHSYAGKQVTLAPGKYGPKHLTIRGIPGEMIRSVQVSPKYSVTFYREPDFQPPQFMTVLDIPDLNAGDMRISSLVISKTE